MKITASTFILILLIFISTSTFAQDEGYTDFDNVMISVSKEISSRIKRNNKIKVAIWDFTDSHGKTNELGDYIRSDFSIHFTNVSNDIQVTNRDNFKQILQEHKLNEEGFIDPLTAKKVGMINAADAIITGTVDVGIHRLRLRIKIIDTETGLQFAAALRNIPIDENMKLILKDTGFYDPVETSQKKRVSNGEKENNPRSTNKKCESLRTGDYCFSNKTNDYYLIDVNGIDNENRRSATARANQDVCFFDLPEGTYKFTMYRNNLRSTMGSDESGSFRIEKCKSVSYSIKSSTPTRTNKKYSTNKKN